MAIIPNIYEYLKSIVTQGSSNVYGMGWPDYSSAEDVTSSVKIGNPETQNTSNLETTWTAKENGFILITFSDVTPNTDCKAYLFPPNSGGSTYYLICHGQRNTQWVSRDCIFLPITKGCQLLKTASPSNSIEFSIYFFGSKSVLSQIGLPDYNAGIKIQYSGLNDGLPINVNVPFVAPSNGIIVGTFAPVGFDATNNIYINGKLTAYKASSSSTYTTNRDCITIIVKEGDSVYASINCSEEIYFYPFIEDSSKRDCVSYVVESGSNGYGFYRKYSDGYIEQWGTRSNVEQPIILPTPFASSNYSVQLTCIDADGISGAYLLEIKSKDVSSFVMKAWTTNNTSVGSKTVDVVDWRACGY